MVKVALLEGSFSCRPVCCSLNSGILASDLPLKQTVVLEYPLHFPFLQHLRGVLLIALL